MRRILLALALAFAAATAQAQVTNPGLRSQGAITPTDCAQFVSAFAVQDSGGACGAGGGITIGQPVTGGTPSTLIYNNSSGNLANSATIPFPLTITPATPGTTLT